MNKLLRPKDLWTLSFGIWSVALCIFILCLFVATRHSESTFSINALPRRSETQAPFPPVAPIEEALSSKAFRLTTIDRPIRLPDLRTTFVFYGSAERPDRPKDLRRIQFGIRGTPTVGTAQVGEKVYLKFDLKTNKWTVVDHPTALSAIFTPLEQNVQVSVTLTDEHEKTITTPAEFHRFALTPSPLPTPTQNHQWSIGSLAVDNTLFDHQGASWYGLDEVVRTFGGTDMEYESERQRVQFRSEEKTYVLWVGTGDCFVFDDDQWNPVEPGERSLGKPLMQAKQVDEKVIHFQIWNSEGTARCNIDLGKKPTSGELSVPPIKIIGARSKKQLIVDIQGKKVSLSPDDWIVLQPEGPVQLTTTRLLDDYIAGRIQGDLLVFSGTEKIHGELSLTGTFFDATRTRKESFAASMYRSWNTDKAKINALAFEDDSFDDDDDFDDDEDLDDEDDDE